MRGKLLSLLFLVFLVALTHVSHTNPGASTQRTPNRLVREQSPYLQQHAYDPVDWYPWGEDAFKKAQREDKAIFLSIGYSACHWCHVMQKECFEAPEFAKILNESFVSILVDREERPDIDRIYMNAHGVVVIYFVQI